MNNESNRQINHVVAPISLNSDSTKQVSNEVKKVRVVINTKPEKDNNFMIYLLIILILIALLTAFICYFVIPRYINHVEANNNTSTVFNEVTISTSNGTHIINDDFTITIGDSFYVNDKLIDSNKKVISNSLALVDDLFIVALGDSTLGGTTIYAIDKTGKIVYSLNKIEEFYLTDNITINPESIQLFITKSDGRYVHEGSNIIDICTSNNIPESEIIEKTVNLKYANTLFNVSNTSSLITISKYKNLITCN